MTDAIVVGAGPNGLSAAIVLAQAGLRVTIYEAQATIGGGCRSAELTRPGFIHDVCSAVHPMALASPFLRALPLASHGLEWVEPGAMVAHPLDNDLPGVIDRSVRLTARGLGDDQRAYERLIGSIVDNWPKLEDAVFGPPSWPQHPIALARFGIAALQPATRLARWAFATPRARALLAGIGAHAMLPLERFPTGAVGLVLNATAHTAGWAFPRGGAQRLSDALARYFRSLGGEIVTSAPIASIDDLPASRTVLFDLSPRPLLKTAGSRFPDWYRRQLERYRYGLGVFKVDWALDAPIPWRDAIVAGSGTVHLGGTLEEIADSERVTWSGRASRRPYVLLAQPTLFDPTRAPEGKHTAWAYCHVPHASSVDMLPAIEEQIERFAPGFRDRVIARHVMTPGDFERMNPNLVGGDIAAGVTDLRQLVARPTLRWYSTPASGIYICSASTPPGVGVHGMCGYHAAMRALKDLGLEVSGAPRRGPVRG
jgi:phytoene dehydrogenase-like protein